METTTGIEGLPRVLYSLDYSLIFNNVFGKLYSKYLFVMRLHAVILMQFRLPPSPYRTSPNCVANTRVAAKDHLGVTSFAVGPNEFTAKWNSTRLIAT